MANHGWHRNDIENPEAYARAIKASIYARATAKRAREWDAAHPELATWLNWDGGEYAADEDGQRVVVGWQKHPLGPVPSFARDAREKWGSLTDGQTAALQRIYDERTQRNTDREAQRAAEAATAQPWTAGRQVVEGVILSTKSIENDFGGAFKMLVKREDGSKLWVSVPSSIIGQGGGQYRGLWVQMTVTVQPKQGEETFAFGSRPAKARVIWAEGV